MLMTKEEMDPEKISGKIAVVLDVLLATSTVAATLADGAAEVIPAIDSDQALQKAKTQQEGRYVLAGENCGRAIDGFLYPDALGLKDKIPGKTLILSTTNGTVAVHRASAAKRVYVASLLNGEAVGRKVAETYPAETIILVCSGSAGRFNMEDFYGAGYVIDCMLNNNENRWEITDAARTALYFYRMYRDSGEKILADSRVGNKLVQLGFEDKIRYVARQGVLSVIPILQGESIIREEDLKDETI